MKVLEARVVKEARRVILLGSQDDNVTVRAAFSKETHAVF